MGKIKSAAIALGRVLTITKSRTATKLSAGASLIALLLGNGCNHCDPADIGKKGWVWQYGDHLGRGIILLDKPGDTIVDNLIIIKGIPSFRIVRCSAESLVLERLEGSQGNAYFKVFQD